jgi:hypothetical protein
MARLMASPRLNDVIVDRGHMRHVISITSDNQSPFKSL